MASAVMEKDTDNKNEVKLSKPTGMSKKKSEPTKRTLNLMIREKRSINPGKWIPGVAVVLVVAVIFGKFAVADRFAKLSAAESELQSLKNTLDDTRAAYSDFNEVQEQYNKYSYTGFDRTIADRLDVMDLLERQVFPVCEVQTLSMAGKTVNMSLTELNLSQVSQLIASLEAEPLVRSVYVSTANHSNEDEFGTATMTVELNDATTVEGGAVNE